MRKEIARTRLFELAESDIDPAAQHETPEGRVSTINHMFKSAASRYGERVIGVILTGLLRDGTEGLKAVHQAGGLTVVQDPREAEYGDMPGNAMEKLPVTFCLELGQIGPALELLVRRSARFETGLAVAVRTLRDASPCWRACNHNATRGHKHF
jgi:chemotaxis response regulator CheB